MTMDADHRSEKSAEVEAFLLRETTWVRSDAICLRFQVRERYLRAFGDQPGICSAFAISGMKGFRHIRCCTDAEWMEFRMQLNAHATSEMSRVKTLGRKRELALAEREEEA